MRSNYKRIGNYVRQTAERNGTLTVTNLQGVSITKAFMPSVANINGTDMSNYKIVNKDQFAFNPMHVGRDEVLPIALLETEEPVIVSPAYVVFEIIDTQQLLPEYLMMWCRRTEFDRNAWFTTDNSIRGSFSWNDFCDMEFPVPSQKIQQELIIEFHTIIERIRLNEQLSEKLEEAAQTVYKQWFEDFEFPISTEYAKSIGKPDLAGQPYKSSGGELEFNKTLDRDIPKSWSNGGIDDIADIIDGDRGDNYPSQKDLLTKGDCLFLNTGNVTKSGFSFNSTNFILKIVDEKLRKGKLKREDVVLTTRGTVGNSAFYSDVIEFNNIRINSGMILLRAKNELSTPLFIYYSLRNRSIQQSVESFLSGSAQQHLPIKELKNIPILIPKIKDIYAFTEYCSVFQHHLDVVKKQTRQLVALRDILLKK